MTLARNKTRAKPQSRAKSRTSARRAKVKRDANGRFAPKVETLTFQPGTFARGPVEPPLTAREVLRRNADAGFPNLMPGAVTAIPEPGFWRITSADVRAFAPLLILLVLCALVVGFVLAMRGGALS